MLIVKHCYSQMNLYKNTYEPNISIVQHAAATVFLKRSLVVLVCKLDGLGKSLGNSFSSALQSGTARFLDRLRRPSDTFC